MTRRENAQKMMFRKNNKIPNCPRPDFDKKNSDFRERGKWKSVVVTAYPTQDWGTRSDVTWRKYVHGNVRRSEIIRLLHLNFTRQSNIPEIQIEDCLGDAIIVLVLQ